MSEIQLEVSYFNEKMAIWEPLIEPVMVTEGNYQPWKVIVKVSIKDISVKILNYTEVGVKFCLIFKVML